MAHPGGRPSSFDPKYCKSLIDFFSITPIVWIDEVHTTASGKTHIKKVPRANTTPFLINWQIQEGIDHTTMMNWTRTYPEFLAAYYIAKKKMEFFLAECGLKEAHNAFMTNNTLKNCCGWRDQIDIKTDTTINVSIENKSSNEFMNKEENRVARLTGQAN